MASSPIIRTTPVAAVGGYKTESPFHVSVSVPAGAICVVTSGSRNSFDELNRAYTSVVVSDADNHTWTERAHQYSADAEFLFAGVWIHEWYNAGMNTVTLNIVVDFSAFAYNAPGSVVVQVLENVKNPAFYQPQVVSAGNLATPSVSLTPTTVGSQVVAGVARKVNDDETNNTALLPVSGCVVDTSPSAQWIDQNYMGAAVARSQTETSTSAPVTIGASAPAGVLYTIVAVEYIPTDAIPSLSETHFRVRVDGTWQQENSLTMAANAWQQIIHYGIYRLPDTTPPAIPILTVDTSGQTQLVATFSATDEVGVSEYRIRIDGGAWVTNATSPHVFTGLTANTAHTIDVQAYDAAGNMSAASWTGNTSPEVTSPDGRAYTAAILADSPAIYYAMQEQSGAQAVDWSGNAKHGTYVGNMVVDYTGNSYAFPEPALGRCVVTANAADNNQYTKIADNSVNVTSGVTIEVWARVVSWGYNAHYCDLSDSANMSDIELLGSATNTTVRVKGIEVNAPAVSAKQWHHIVATISPAGQATIYIDGVQAGSGTTGKPTQQTRSNMYFGRAVGSSNYIDGMWTQCAIYNKVLTSSQIANHYTVGVSDQDPVWHGIAEWHDPSTYTQWPQTGWLDNPNRVFFGDWMPSYDGLDSITRDKPYYDIGFCQTYWSSAIDPIYQYTQAQYAERAISEDMRMIPDSKEIGTGYDGPDVVAFAGPDEADMHDPTNPNDVGNYNTLLAELAKIKATGKMGYVNYGSLITMGHGSPAVAPEVYANLDGFFPWTADLYFYSVGNETYTHLNTYWDLSRDQCRRACNYGALIERQRGMLKTPRPIWGIIELAHPNDTPDAGGPNPNQVEGAVWGSLIGGARGIEWFHHSFVGSTAYPTWSATTDYQISQNVAYNGKYYYAALKPAVGEEPTDTSYTWVRFTNNSGANVSVESARHPDLLPRISKIRSDVNAVAPAIYSPTTPHLCHKSIYSTYRANTSDGKKYIIAMPGLKAPNGGTFSMYLPKGEAPTSIEVVGEGRTITPSGGTFTDTFAAEYSHHVYRW